MQNKSDQYDISSKLGDLFALGRNFFEDTFKLNEYYLVNAVEQSDLKVAEQCLAAGIDPNMPDGLGRLPLGVAAEKGSKAFLELLLNAGADPNILDGNGKLPLVFALAEKNMECIEILLNYGANPYLNQRNKVSAYGRATEMGYTTILERFSTPEIQSRRYEKDRRLHEEQKAKYRQTLARQAKKRAEKQRKEESEKLDLYGFEPGNELDSLQRAIEAKDSDALRLITARCESEILNEPLTNGDTLIHKLVRSKAEKAASFLLNQGANPFITNSNGSSAFTEAIKQKMDDFIKNCLTLPQVKEVLNSRTALLSPLFLAYQNPVYWLWFLKADADPTWGGKMGINPMLKAVQKGSVAILPVWKICGIDLNRSINGTTLLKEAVVNGRKDWMQALLTEDVEPLIETLPMNQWIQENLPDSDLLNNGV